MPCHEMLYVTAHMKYQTVKCPVKNVVTYIIVLSTVIKWHVIKCHEKKNMNILTRVLLKDKQSVTDGQAYIQNLTNRSLMLPRFSDLSNHSDKIVLTYYKIPSHF